MRFEEDSAHAAWDALWVNASGARVANRFGYSRDDRVRAEMANGFAR